MRRPSAARDQMGLLDQSVRTAEESLRLTKLRYSAGEATALEVVDAAELHIFGGDCPGGRGGPLRKRLGRTASADRNTCEHRRRRYFTDQRIGPRALPLAVILLCVVFLHACKKTGDDDAASCCHRPGGTSGRLVRFLSISWPMRLFPPLAQAAISPKITAPVQKFYVQRGSKVKAGHCWPCWRIATSAAQALDNKGQYDGGAGSLRHADEGAGAGGLQQGGAGCGPGEGPASSCRSRLLLRGKNFSQEGAIAGRDYDTPAAALVQAQAAYDVAQNHLASLKA